MINIHLDPPYNTDELNALAVMIAALGGRAGVTVDTLHGEHRGVSDRWDEQPNYSAADDDEEASFPSMPPELPPSTPAPGSAAVPLPPATAPSPNAGVETDSEGLPWDARIHAETKRKTKDERWARRRNTTDELWNSVRAQLQQTMAATGVPSGPAIEAQALGQPLSPETIDAAAAFTTATLVPPAPIPAPPVAVPPPPAAAQGEDEFTRILTKTVAMQTAGTITPEQVNAICAQLGLPEGVRSLMSRPDLLPQFEMMLGA